MSHGAQYFCHPFPSKHIFLTAQLQSYEILGSVPDPGAETRPGTLPPTTPACCQDPLPPPPHPAPPFSSGN